MLSPDQTASLQSAALMLQLTDSNSHEVSAVLLRRYLCYDAFNVLICLLRQCKPPVISCFLQPRHLMVLGSVTPI